MDRKINYALDLPANLTWYYDKSAELTSLITSKAAWYAANYADFNESWFNSVFNLKTANLFGCVVWCYILDVPTELAYTPKSARAPWGLGGGRGNFEYNNFGGSVEQPTLALDEIRRLLRIRYYAQTMSNTVVNINGALKDVFGDLGIAYVRGGVMTQQYTFSFALSPNFKQALLTYLPRGAGVASSIVSP